MEKIVMQNTLIKPWEVPIDTFHPRIRRAISIMISGYNPNDILKTSVLKLNCPVSGLELQTTPLIETYIHRKNDNTLEIDIGHDSTFFRGNGFRLMIELLESKLSPPILTNFLNTYFPNYIPDYNKFLYLSYHGLDLCTLWKTSIPRKHRIFHIIDGSLVFIFRNGQQYELKKGTYAIDFTEWHYFYANATATYFAFDADKKDWEQYVI